MTDLLSKLKTVKQDLTSTVTQQALIYGANTIGFKLAQQLTKLSRDVVIIAEDEQRLKRIQEELDVMALVGSGVDLKTLKRARIGKTALILAVSENDEKNILTSIYAHKLGVERIVAQVSDDDYLNNNDFLINTELGIDLLINPEEVVVEQIGDLIRPSMESGIESFIDGKVQISEVTISHRNPFAFNKISQLNLPRNSLIIGVLRRNRLFIPYGEHKLYPGDTIYILGKKGFRTKLGQLLSKNRRKKQKVVLAGGSEINYRLALNLAGKQSILTLIEAKQERCEELAEEISDLLVLNGKAINIDLLKEEGIEQADVFVAAGANDEENLLTGLAAKSLGCKKVITIVNSLEYSYFSEIVDVDTILSPQILVLEKILDFLHQGQVDTETILDGQMHLLKLEVPDRVGRRKLKLKQLKHASDLIIGVVIRDEELIIPDGELRLRVADQLLVFTLTAKNNLLAELFGDV
ncbi:Trk system potassium transporter TrkA [Fuchsiella alkaliacetigena]|uniref:Trk system potassium transporter TrkA n=1 Tax=Fuchsiella alkaliacetigena TaxID=957042 RepID=UPI00200A3569|nr:Trk system potassium transporter TrkA [Fuchsiella alkaliacetigena]MCK8823852.1 Trk system potassium transporter TrkA [Fuchsiella alkaliacetigena]